MARMHWFPDRLSPRLLSTLGYWITYAPMAHACWYNAYTPEGLTIASGQLTRCLHACEQHHAFGERRLTRGARPLRLGGRAKRQFRPLNHRKARARAHAPTISPPC